MGVGVKYDSINESVNPSGAVCLSGTNPIASGTLTSTYWDAAVNQYVNMWAKPNQLSFSNYSGLGKIEYYVLFFTKEKDIVIDSAAVKTESSGTYYHVDENKVLKSVTIVFSDYTYNRSGSVNFINQYGICGSAYFLMNRSDERVKTVNVTPQSDKFEIVINNGDGDNSIEAVYLNYE